MPSDSETESQRYVDVTGAKDVCDLTVGRGDEAFWRLQNRTWLRRDTSVGCRLPVSIQRKPSKCQLAEIACLENTKTYILGQTDSALLFVVFCCMDARSDRKTIDLGKSYRGIGPSFETHGSESER